MGLCGCSFSCCLLPTPLQARATLAANIHAALRQVSAAQALTLCVTLPPPDRQMMEDLEQLKVLENGHRMKVGAGLAGVLYLLPGLGGAAEASGLCVVLLGIALHHRITCAAWLHTIAPSLRPSPTAAATLHPCCAGRGG